MIPKALGYFVIAFLGVLAVATKVLYDQNEKSRPAAVANLQPEISPPPPDEMWAQKPPARAVRKRRGLQMQARPSQTTGPRSNEPVASPTPALSPSANPDAPTSRLDPLLRDRDQLQRQIWQLNPDQLDQQITNRQQELQQLQTQLQQYQAAAQNVDRQATESVQFRSVVQQTQLNELDDRIRVQERLVQSSHEQQQQVNLNPGMYDASVPTALQTQSTVQEQQLQDLLAQRSMVSAQTMDDLNRLNQQVLSDHTAIESARVAVQTEMRYVEQDLNRLSQEKANAEALRAQYQREANQIENQLRALGADQKRLKSINFP